MAGCVDMIQVKSDWSEVLRDIDRIGDRMPTMKMKEALDSVFALAFLESNANVHVETGSLKTSGKKKSKGSKVSARWVGEISYGGPSGGVHNPVDYAIYEKSRGGSHDFFNTLPLLHPFFINAIKRGLD